jgi:signal transduction histidine kinase
MYTFLINNRDEILNRSRENITLRLGQTAIPEYLVDAIPLFLGQLERTFLADETTGEARGAQGGLTRAAGETKVADMSFSRAVCDEKLTALSFTVDHVVHDYGDVCRAVTDLAVEHEIPFAVKEFRILNGCLDSAIANAMTVFSFEHDAAVETERTAEVNRRLGYLMHEVRNALGIATMAALAMEARNLTIKSATGVVLTRSLATLTALTNRTLEEVKRAGALEPIREVLSIAVLLEHVREDAQFEASAKGCQFVVAPVDPGMFVRANGPLLLAAIGNLVQNALKFTLPHTAVTLRAYIHDGHVRIDVADHCGGLSVEATEKLFTPFFSQSGQGTAGLGLGLSIALATVVAEGGMLTVKDVPDTGCIFTIELPAFSA